MITMGGPDAYNTPEMKVVYNAPKESFFWQE